MKTDNELSTDVEAQLSWDPSFDDHDIVVAAKGGVVTLTGRVAAYAHRLAAEKAAKCVAGVRAIANDIEVRPTSEWLRADSEIAAAVVSALKSNVSVPAESIQAIVRDGWITLEGTVARWFQKDAAENALRGLWGVRGITNSIVLRPQIHIGDVRDKIHQSFKRHADLDADTVQVAVADGTVSLTGEVHSWHEREDAEAAAWSAPGVSRVKNDLTVSL